MNAAELKDSQVSILISDPWEFATECGTGPFTGLVTDATEDRLVIALRSPIAYRGRALKTIIARSRHVGVGIQAIATGVMASNFVLLPNTLHSVAELDPSMSVAGVAAVGTIEQLT